MFCKKIGFVVLILASMHDLCVFARTAGTVQTRYRGPVKEQAGFLVYRRLILPSDPPRTVGVI